MSHTVNRVTLLGRVGTEPEMRYTPGGTAVTQLRLATNRRRQNGETEADWHTITAWEKLAEDINQYVEKGQRLYVEGRLAQNYYEDKDGQRRHTTEVYAKWAVFLDGDHRNSSRREDIEFDEDNSPF